MVAQCICCLRILCSVLRSINETPISQRPSTRRTTDESLMSDGSVVPETPQFATGNHMPVATTTESETNKSRTSDRFRVLIRVTNANAIAHFRYTSIVIRSMGRNTRRCSERTVVSFNVAICVAVKRTWATRTIMP